MFILQRKFKFFSKKKSTKKLRYFCRQPFEKWPIQNANIIIVCLKLSRSLDSQTANGPEQLLLR